MLDNLNSKTTGALGVTAGSLTVVGATIRLFELLSDPTYLTALLKAAQDHAANTATQADVATIMQLVGALIAVGGAMIVALLAANIGKSLFKGDNAAGISQSVVKENTNSSDTGH